MANKKIGIILAADGEKEFLQALSNVKKESALLGSELKKLDTDYKGNANSLEYLSKKQELLEKRTESYQKKVESSKKGLANATEVSQKAADKYEELKKSLEKAQKAQEEMEKSGQSGTKEYQKQTKEVDELVKAVEKQGLECQKCEGKVTDWNKKITDAETDLKKNSQALEQNAKYLKEAETSTDATATSIDEYGKKVKGATEITSNFGEKLQNAVVEGITSKGIDLVTDAAIKAEEALKETMYDISSASAKLKASTGLSETAAKRYQSVMQQIKGDNFGESYNDVADAMAEVIQIMGELDDQSMLDITESAITLRDTFGMDVNESIRAVDVMMKSMGVDADTAFNLITKGAQNGLNRSGELVDNLAEYGSLWGQAGFSAEEAFAIMENGLDAGAYNLDKVNDFVKEFGISLTDGRIEENIQSFSTETQDFFEKWQDGEASTKDVFYSIISDLESMTSEQEALTLASDIWSSLGEDNALTVLTALNDVNTGYQNIQGTMAELKEMKFSDLESAVGNLGSAVQESFITPIANVALPALTTAINGIADAIAPAQEEIDTTFQDIVSKSEEIKENITSIEKELSTTFEDADEVGSLAERLAELNSVEEKTTVQKREMAAIVEKLSYSIPELKGAYDEENGSLSITNKELETLVKNYQKVAVEQALTAATQELINQELEQQVQLDAAEEQKEVVSGRLGLLQDELALINEITNAQFNGDYSRDYKTEAMTLYKKALDEGIITLEEFEQAEKALDNSQMDNRFQVLNGVITQCGDSTGIFAENVVDLAAEEAILDKTIEETQEAIDDCDKKIQSYTESAEELYGATTELKESNKDLIESEEDLTDVTEDVNGALSDTGEAAKKAKEATQTIVEAYKSAVESIKEELRNKISLSDVFDGGEDLTTEKMNENLQTWIDGYTGYQTNLQKVREMIDESGEAIFSQEFIQMIQEQGTDAANMLAHMVYTYEEQGEYGIEQLKGINDKYGEALDATDEIAEATAANQTAYSLAMKELGSTSIEFSGLEESIKTASKSSNAGWKDLTTSMEKTLLDAVERAQEIGIQIPEGLTEGIESGEISPQEALEQLNGTIEGTIAGVAEIAKESGLEIPENIQAGIAAGGQEATTALTDLLALLQQQGTLAQEAGAELGSSVAQGTKTAIEEQQESVESAGSALASSGADGAGSKKSEYEEAGEEAAQQFKSGIASQSGIAISAAAYMAGQAASAARRYQNDFFNIGYYMSSGIASGIKSGESLAINAATNMASNALLAVKSYLQIHSPSKKFQDEVGKQISAGTAFGISNNASLAGSAAKKMSKQVYNEATAWLTKYRKSHETSIDDEKYYWEQVITHVKKGTTAYKNAVAELEKLNSSTTITETLNEEISSKFGVSRTKTTGSSTTKKDAEEYYSEIYNAAKDCLEKYKTLHATSLAQEKNYWANVRKQLKSGTDAWYEATQKIQELNTQIAEEKQAAIDTLVSVQDKLLSSYKTYYTMSAKAEMEYWNIARKQFKSGTDERIEADAKYLEAKAAYKEEKLQLDEEYKEARTKIEEELSEKIQELEEERNQAVADRKKEILSSMNGFDAWDATGYDADTLLYNLQTQVAGLSLWEQQLKELSGKNISEGLLEELKEMGPEAAANIYSLNQMTAEQLDEFNKLWEEKNEIAQRQAEKDTQDTWDTIGKEITTAKATAKTELADLKAEYKSAVAELNEGLADGLKSLVTQATKIGEDTVAALIKALRSAGVDTALTVTGATAVAASTQSMDAENTPAVSAVATSIPAYKNGTKNNLKDTLAWLFENNSQEYVLRKADGAVMQNMLSGDKVINPEGADNLYNFATDPDSFINARMGTAGIEKLNQLLNSSTQSMVSSGDNAAIASKMDGVLDAMRYLSEGILSAMQNIQVVMDSGNLVGEIRERLNTENEMAAIRRNRRSY